MLSWSVAALLHMDYLHHMSQANFPFDVIGFALLILHPLREPPGDQASV